MTRIAVIDLGTHNCRLIISEQTPAGFMTVRTQAIIVRLGEGAAATGMLQPAAMARTLLALKRFSEIIAEENVDSIHAVATEACRMASNCDDFLKAIKIDCGLDFEIVSARKEVSLAIRASAPLMEVDRALMFDIGGGSTEIILLEKTPIGIRVCDWVSLPMGVVRGRDAMASSEVSRQEFQSLIQSSTKDMAGFFSGNAIFFERPYQVIGSSGTVTSLAAMVLGLKTYRRDQVDGSTFMTSDMLDFARKVPDMPLAEREAHDIIGPERAEYMVPGCAIFTAILSFLDCDEMTAADRGLREGILNSLMAGAPDVVFSGEGR